MKQLQDTLVNDDTFNVAVTEKDALGYRTTGRSLVDLNFSVASLRSASEDEVVSKFLEAFSEDKDLALKWLFFARDVRQGLGERRLFRVILNHMAVHQPKEIEHLVQYVPEYGRWDDLIACLDSRLSEEIFEEIKYRLTLDLEAKRKGEPISLVAKWLPGVNTSSKETVRFGKMLAKRLGMSDRNYRKMLSSLRKYIDVIEVKMSAKDWGSIDYEKVPSKANLLYRNAFLKNDNERRREYLTSLEKGEVKINASVLYPHDIVQKYMSGCLDCRPIDQTLESLWSALPNTVTSDTSTIVVADGSGSMTDTVGNTNITALSVANALAIYFSERLSGDFKNKYITFSRRPQLVDMGGCATLQEKIVTALQYDEIANTDVEAVFKLILHTAIDARMTQEDIPKNVLIISDMEFDNPSAVSNEKLFDVISGQYLEAGYKLPRLVFWNVNSRTGCIPLTRNELGVALVSGFSINIAQMIMSGELDPYKCLLDMLLSERYREIIAAA